MAALARKHEQPFLFPTNNKELQSMAKKKDVTAALDAGKEYANSVIVVIDGPHSNPVGSFSVSQDDGSVDCSHVGVFDDSYENVTDFIAAVRENGYHFSLFSK